MIADSGVTPVIVRCGIRIEEESYGCLLMTNSTESPRAMAQQILQQALDDLRLESLRAGRGDLFATLHPALLDPSRSPDEFGFGTLSAAEIRLALIRLRARLRERVNARLRALEPDTDRRRALRRRLQATQPDAGEGT